MKRIWPVETLRSLFPTAEQLLAVEPEALAPTLLKLARNRLGPSGFWQDSILTEQSITGEPDNAYPFYKKAQVGAHVNEAWECLRRDGLIVQSPGMNGRNGWMTLTKAGMEATETVDADRTGLLFAAFAHGCFCAGFRTPA